MDKFEILESVLANRRGTFPMAYQTAVKYWRRVDDLVARCPFLDDLDGMEAPDVDDDVFAEFAAEFHTWNREVLEPHTKALKLDPTEAVEAFPDFVVTRSPPRVFDSFDDIVLPRNDIKRLPFRLFGGLLDDTLAPYNVGDVLFVQAGTSDGKTALFSTLMANSVSDGRNVLMINFEDLDMGAKFGSAIATKHGFPISAKFWSKYDKDEIVRNAKKASKQCQKPFGDFRILLPSARTMSKSELAEPLDSYTVCFVEQAIEEFEADYGHLDVLIVDYFSWLYEPISRELMPTLAARNLISKLSSVAFKHDCMVVTALQANREGNSAERRKNRDLTDIGGAFEQARAAQILIDLSKDSTTSTSVIKIKKHRNGMFNPDREYKYKYCRHHFLRPATVAEETEVAKEERKRDNLLMVKRWLREYRGCYSKISLITDVSDRPCLKSGINARSKKWLSIRRLFDAIGLLNLEDDASYWRIREGDKSVQRSVYPVSDFDHAKKLLDKLNVVSYDPTDDNVTKLIDGFRKGWDDAHVG